MLRSGICKGNYKVSQKKYIRTDNQLIMDAKDSKINQLEGRLRKYDTEFVSGSLKARDTRYRDSMSERLTAHSRTVSRDTMMNSEALKNYEGRIYDLKVKVKDQELYIQRLESQLAKNLEVMKRTEYRHVY